MKRLPALALLLISLPASAQWQAVFLSSQLCVESSKVSTSLANAERAAAREKRVQRDEPRDLGAQCESNDDCEGYCIKGRCVEAIDQYERARVEPTQDATPQPPLEPPPSVARCSAETPCAEGQSCMNGFCMSPPPPPSSLLRSGAELFVRHHAVQLRQDLALGEGPAISALARLRGVSATALRRTLRAHREELARMIGGSEDVKWPAPFLDQLDWLDRSSVVRQRFASVSPLCPAPVLKGLGRARVIAPGCFPLPDPLPRGGEGDRFVSRGRPQPVEPLPARAGSGNEPRQD